MDIMGMTLTISGVITVVGALIALSNFFSNRTKRDKYEEARLVRIETLLVKIDENTTDLNNRVKDHDKLLTKHETRISVLEAESPYHNHKVQK